MSGQYLLAFLILVPIAAFWFARHRFSKYLYRIVGVAFGAVVSPWATGLYAFYFLSPWGIGIGLVGLTLTLIHGPLGFHLAQYLGLVSSGLVTELGSQFVIELLNGLIWAAIYGLIGWAFDTVRLKRSGDSTPRSA